jgi:hypothetical protein
MRRSLSALLFLLAPLSGYAVEQMIPAGSMVQCTISEPKLSSKTTDIGDPILCQVGHVELRGRSVFPYGSYLEGRFEDYKDPGHLVGKGWMELKFDRMFVPPGQIIPITAKVVAVPKFPVDKQGKIHGKGHPVRDTVEWMIPVLWPIDLLNLPRRGPRPILKAETRLTLKIMDDFGVPDPNPTYSQYQQQPYYPAPRDQYGYSQRPMTYTPPPTPPPAPVYQQMTYQQPPAPPSPTVLMLRNGHRTVATQYWFEGGGAQFRYIALNGTPMICSADLLDVPATVAVNRTRGISFNAPSYLY